MAPVPPVHSARVEIDYRILARLLRRGQMRACELRCLDPESKELLRQLCLHTCLAACRKRD